MMRALAAAACLVGVAIVISGCGVDKNPGKIAVKTIEDDWEGFYVASSDPFPARPDLAGHDTIRSIRCEHEDERGADAAPARSSSVTARAAARRRPCTCS